MNSAAGNAVGVLVLAGIGTLFGGPVVGVIVGIVCLFGLMADDAKTTIDKGRASKRDKLLIEHLKKQRR